MEKISLYLKENSLCYTTEISKDMFENHISEFKKRVKTNEKLDVEMDDSLFNSIDEKVINHAKNIISLLTEKKIEQYDTELFLIATHVMMMEDKNE